LTASLLLTASLILTGPAEGASGADFDGIADFDGTAVSHASCCFSRFLLFHGYRPSAMLVAFIGTFHTTC
jgi:hypothetical protein